MLSGCYTFVVSIIIVVDVVCDVMPQLRRQKRIVSVDFVSVNDVQARHERRWGRLQHRLSLHLAKLHLVGIGTIRWSWEKGIRKKINQLGRKKERERKIENTEMINNDRYTCWLIQGKNANEFANIADFQIRRRIVDFGDDSWTCQMKEIIKGVLKNIN